MLTNNKLFNDDIKKMYFESSKSTYRAKVYIEPLSEYEFEIGKDVAEMNKVETAEAISRCKYSKYTTIAIAVGQVKRYKEWFTENIRDIPLSNLLFSWEDIDITEYYKNSMIRSSIEIKNSFSRRKPSEGHLVQPTLALSFCGVESTAICKLKDRDVLVVDDEVIVMIGNNKTVRFKDAVSADIIREYQEHRRYCHCETDMFLYRPRKPQSVIGQNNLSRMIKECRSRELTGTEFDNNYMTPSLVKLSGDYIRIIDAMENGQEYKKLIMDSGVESAGSRSSIMDQFLAGLNCYRKAFEI